MIAENTITKTSPILYRNDLSIDADLRGRPHPIKQTYEWLQRNKANLSKSNLISADLTGINLSKAILINANLIRADLSGADLSVAKLFYADLSKVIGLDRLKTKVGIRVFWKTIVPDDFASYAGLKVLRTANGILYLTNN